MRVFLDANILFSASLGGPSFSLFWEIARSGKVILVSSRYCLGEAQVNLERKRPSAVVQFKKLSADVGVVPEAPERFEWAKDLVPVKDIPVLAAAAGCTAAVLLTGDIADFGPLMTRSDLPIRVRTLRMFLLDGPK